MEWITKKFQAQKENPRQMSGVFYFYSVNKILKIGLIGFSSTIGIAILLRFLFGISTIYIAPLALPWGMVVIIGALKKKNGPS